MIKFHSKMLIPFKTCLTVQYLYTIKTLIEEMPNLMTTSFLVKKNPNKTVTT